MVGMRSFDRRVISRNPRPPATKILLCTGSSASRLDQKNCREPVLHRDVGQPGVYHRPASPVEPPRAVASLATIIHWRPRQHRCRQSRGRPEMSSIPMPASGAISRKIEPSSRSNSTRSRGSSLPRSRWRGYTFLRRLGRFDQFGAQAFNRGQHCCEFCVLIYCPRSWHRTHLVGACIA